jgi:hypothetical protein
MARKEARTIFGVHSVTPYNPSTGEFYGTAKVLGEASAKLSGELVKLMGGASPYPWKIESGTISSEFSMKLREYPDFLFELLAGKAPTSSGADTAGAVSALTNVKGTSLQSATTGIASIAVKAAVKADLKFGKYILKATSTTAVKVYAASDVDFNRGTDKTLLEDNLEVAGPFTVVASTATEITGFGLEITGGSGTIGMTIGDTASFEVKPPSTESMEVKVGGSADTSPEFGMIIMAQKQGSGEMVELDVFRAKGIGLPIGFTEKAFSEAEVSVEAFYDSAKDGVFKLRHIKPSSAS